MMQVHVVRTWEHIPQAILSTEPSQFSGPVNGSGSLVSVPSGLHINNMPVTPHQEAQYPYIKDRFGLTREDSNSMLSQTTSTDVEGPSVRGAGGTTPTSSACASDSARVDRYAKPPASHPCQRAVMQPGARAHRQRRVQAEPGV